MKKTYKRWLHQEQNHCKEVTVEQKTIGRGHKYVVSGFNKDYDGVQMPSVTGITGATDGSGTSPIARWQVKHALGYILEKKVPISKAIYDELLASKEELLNLNSFTDKQELAGWIIQRYEDEVTTTLVEAKGIPDQVLKKAGNRGTRIHNAVEAYLTGNTTSLDHKVYSAETIKIHADQWQSHLTDEDSTESLKVCFEKIESWIAEMGFKIKGTELPVFHTDLAVGGAIDIVLSNEDNTIYVCDFKTGSNIYFKDALQVSAYIACIASMIGNGIDIWSGYKDQMHHRVDELQLGGAVIHIDEEHEKVSINHLPEQLIGGQAFLHATLLYEAQKYSKYHSVKL